MRPRPRARVFGGRRSGRGAGDDRVTVDNDDTGDTDTGTGTGDTDTDTDTDSDDTCDDFCDYDSCYDDPTVHTDGDVTCDTELIGNGGNTDARHPARPAPRRQRT